MASHISWSFPHGDATGLSLPDSYPYNTTRYAIENFLSTHESETDAPSYMHGNDIIQSSWEGTAASSLLNLGLYCLGCTVQDDQATHSCLGRPNEAGFTEVWIDVGIAREGTGSDVIMPLGTDGRQVEYNSRDPSTLHVRNRDFVCVFQMQQQGQGQQEEESTLSSILLTMGDANSSPLFYNATYRTGHPKHLVDAAEPEPLEAAPLLFTFPGPGNVSGLNSDADMTTYLEHALHDPNTEYWGGISSSATMPEAEDLIEVSWTGTPDSNEDSSDIVPVSMNLTCFVCLEPYSTDSPPSSHCNDWANIRSSTSTSNPDSSEDTSDDMTEISTTDFFINSTETSTRTLSIEIPLLRHYPSQNQHTSSTFLSACTLSLLSATLSSSPPSYTLTHEKSAYSKVFFATQPSGNQHTRAQYVFSAQEPGGVPSGRQRAREEREEREVDVEEAVGESTSNPGTKAGIAIGVVLGVGMVGYLAWVWWGKRDGRRREVDGEGGV